MDYATILLYACIQTDIARIKTLEKELRSSSKAAGGSVEEVSPLHVHANYIMSVIHFQIFDCVYVNNLYREKRQRRGKKRSKVVFFCFST